MPIGASLGRRVDVSWARSNAGVEIKVNPGLELLLDHDLRALAAQLPDLKGAALKAVSHVRLSGVSPSVLAA